MEILGLRCVAVEIPGGQTILHFRGDDGNLDLDRRCAFAGTRAVREHMGTHTCHMNAQGLPDMETNEGGTLNRYHHQVVVFPRTCRGKVVHTNTHITAQNNKKR